jgi:SNF family Na+-dependent transporter
MEERMVNQNTGRGLLLAAVAFFFLVQAPKLTIGSLSRPGPGLFPVMVASLLLLIAIVIVVRSRFIEAVPLDFRFRNIALIAASLVTFTLVSEFVNMLAGVAVMVTLASLASEDFSIPRTATIVVALCLIAFAMKRLLGVQLPLY